MLISGRHCAAARRRPELSSALMRRAPVVWPGQRFGPPGPMARSCHRRRNFHASFQLDTPSKQLLTAPWLGHGHVCFSRWPSLHSNSPEIVSCAFHMFILSGVLGREYRCASLVERHFGFPRPYGSDSSLPRHLHDGALRDARCENPDGHACSTSDRHCCVARRPSRCATLHPHPVSQNRARVLPFDL